jgi:hypothetical protein
MGLKLWQTQRRPLGVMVSQGQGCGNRSATRWGGPKWNCPSAPRRVFVPCVITPWAAPRFSVGPTIFLFIDDASRSDFYPPPEDPIARDGFDGLIGPDEEQSGELAGLRTSGGLRTSACRGGSRPGRRSRNCRASGCASPGSGQVTALALRRDGFARAIKRRAAAVLWRDPYLTRIAPADQPRPAPASPRG